MLTAPELVIPEPVELFDKIEISANLQNWALANGVVRSKKRAVTQAKVRHDQ